MSKVEYNTDALKVIADMTVQLTQLRQNECKHLCIENFAPKLFVSFLSECGFLEPPQVFRDASEMLRR